MNYNGFTGVFFKTFVIYLPFIELAKTLISC